MATTGLSPRRPELDAIRLVVVLGLVFFHSALVFDTRDDFYVKNDRTTEATTIAAGLAVVWAMPMLFYIAGLGAHRSLQHRSVRAFTGARLVRLGVPLVVATVTIVPVPPWLRLKAADPGYDETYWQFLRRFLAVHLDPAGFPFVLDGRYFETGHLWFVVLLLTFSLMAAAAVAWAPRRPVLEVVDRFSNLAGDRRAAVLLPAVPLAAVSAALGLEEGLAGWSRWAYLLFFALGFTIGTDDAIRRAMRRDALLATGLGLALFVATAPVFMTLDDPFTSQSTPAVLGRTAFGAAGWCWLVAILGLLERRRRPVHHSSRDEVYRYLLAAVLPIYVLHQPIVVAVAYWVVGWPLAAPLKYVVISLASLVLTIAAQDVLRRVLGPTGRKMSALMHRSGSRIRARPPTSCW
jgi:glucan biosynthesis protein C